MEKKELALEVIRRLKEEYPLAECTLDYDHAWQLLVEVRLAAQCTDARVNIVVKDLFAKYPSVEALADATVEEIEAIVKPCGLGHSKARDISLCMKKLRDEFGGRVPDDFDALLSLPGVGRKTANVVLSVGFGQPRIAVDTHVFRVANRIGLVHEKDVLKTELALMEKIPEERWSRTHHSLIFHGRQCCDARKPKCDVCPIHTYCEYVNGPETQG